MDNKPFITNEDSKEIMVDGYRFTLRPVSVRDRNKFSKQVREVRKKVPKITEIVLKIQDLEKTIEKFGENSPRESVVLLQELINEFDDIQNEVYEPLMVLIENLVDSESDIYNIPTFTIFEVGFNLINSMFPSVTQRGKSKSSSGLSSV